MGHMTAKTDRKRILLIVTGILLVLVTVLVLRAEGRRFLCACGYFVVWVSDWCGSNTSQQLFDPYSFTHILHGFLFFWLIALLFKRMRWEWQLWLAVLVESAWEVIENTPWVIEKYRTETAALGYTGDTIVNSIGDLTCAVIGFLVARRLGVRRAVIVFLLIELVLIFWIRDSLLLQILMLVHPIEAIKVWQTCH